jgi:hypothetical protein
MNDPSRPLHPLRTAPAAIVLCSLSVLGAARAQAHPAEPTEPAEPAENQAAPKAADALSDGVALRARYVSVPGWMLGLFTARGAVTSR